MQITHSVSVCYYGLNFCFKILVTKLEGMALYLPAYPLYALTILGAKQMNTMETVKHLSIVM